MDGVSKMMVGDDFKQGGEKADGLLLFHVITTRVEHMSLLGSSGTYIIVHEGQSVWS